MKKITSRSLLVFAFAALMFLSVNLQAFWRFFVAENSPEALSGPVVLTPPLTLSIPSLSVSAPVVFPEKIDETEFQKALGLGVVHYPGTAGIGERGNCYLFGHSSDYPWSAGRYKTVFASLPKIREGDGIHLTDQQGRRFTYKVTKKYVVSPKDLSVLEASRDNVRELTLQTSYPLGTAWQRYIVRAELSD